MSVNLRPYLNETKKCRQLIAKIVKPKKSTRIKDKNISVVYASELFFSMQKLLANLAKSCFFNFPSSIPSPPKYDLWLRFVFNSLLWRGKINRKNPVIWDAYADIVFSCKRRSNMIVWCALSCLRFQMEKVGVGRWKLFTFFPFFRLTCHGFKNYFRIRSSKWSIAED